MLRPGKLVAHSMGRRVEGWSGRRGARGCAVLLVCAAFGLTLGVGALSAASAPSFARARSYATGRHPVSLALGDLSGDGKLDLATANDGSNTASVLINTPGLCTVQHVEGQTVPAAKRTIARANCRVGKIRRAQSKRVKKGRVISQKPRFGAVLPGGGKVNLVVSRGRRLS